MEPVERFVSHFSGGAWSVGFNGHRYNIDARTLVIAIVSRIGLWSFKHIQSNGGNIVE
jgi:hypothetical protein